MSAVNKQTVKDIATCLVSCLTYLIVCRMLEWHAPTEVTTSARAGFHILMTLSAGGVFGESDCCDRHCAHHHWSYCVMLGPVR
jgi:hypothetical protein